MAHYRITQIEDCEEFIEAKREAHSREGGQIESPTRREFQFDSLRLSIQREEPTFRKNPRKIVIQLLRSPIVEIHQCHQIHEGVLISWSKCSDEITAGDLHRFVRRFVAAHVASEAGELVQICGLTSLQSSK